MALSKILENSITDGVVSAAKLKDFAAAVDLNGVELILDADQDTSITADTDDRIDFKIAGVEHISISNSSGDTVIKPMVDAKDIVFQQYDGNKIFEINDANFVAVSGAAAGPGEIRIYEDTDNGTHYTGFKAGNNTASVAYVLPTADGSSGEQLTTDGSGTLSWSSAGTTLANDANNRVVTATGSGLNGEANLTFDGSTLAVTGAITGSSDLTLQDDLILDSDSAVLSFGEDNEITITHVADTGLNIKHTATGDDKPIVLTLQTGETDIAANDVIGTINFQAPDEGTGTDAILVAAGISAISEGDFSSSANATKLSFKTAVSAAASETMSLTSNGDLFLAGGLIDLKNDGNAVSQIKFYCESSNAHAQTLIGAPHSEGATNVLTLPGTGGDARLVSTASTATLTNKTLTSPVINTGTFGTSILPVSADGTTLGSASKEFSDLFLADSSTIQFGNDQDTTLTHTDGAGLTLNSTNKLMFNDASQFIQGSSATVLSIGATDEIDLTATTVDLNGTLNVSGVATFQAAPVFPDGSIAVADLDIDGATDIGAAIVDADLFIVDDGAGGTNRKVTASRLKTYAGFSVADITGATALTAEPNSADEFLLSDAGTLKRIDFKHMSNTPAFEAVFNTQVTGVSDNTYTKAAYNVESYDTDSAYDTSAYRFTPGVAGKYYVYMNIIFDAQGVDKFHSVEVAIYKNGSIHRKAYFDQYDNYLAYAKTPYLACSVTLDDDDYVEGYLLFNVVSGTNHRIDTGGVFGAFRLIGH